MRLGTQQVQVDHGLLVIAENELELSRSHVPALDIAVVPSGEEKSKRRRDQNGSHRTPAMRFRDGPQEFAGCKIVAANTAVAPAADLNVEPSDDLGARADGGVARIRVTHVLVVEVFVCDEVRVQVPLGDCTISRARDEGSRIGWVS